MVKKKKSKHNKVVDERYTFSKNRGGGLIKIEVWEDQYGAVVRYNMAYINFALYSGDHGRVIGYDNAHNYHHRHCFGVVSPVNDFVGYEVLLEHFEAEVRGYLNEH
ncbi:MAG: DUF6516 family protein [Gammaproteobacteria bacterium]|nr:DUF6516 family protein [Gammaproteobacteria bacterium]